VTARALVLVRFGQISLAGQAAERGRESLGDLFASPADRRHSSLHSNQ